MKLTYLLFDNRLRSGMALNDPVLPHLKSMDLSVPIFFFLYGGIFSFLYYIIPRPQTFVPAVRAFVVLFAIRTAFIYLVPLAPPVDLVPLRDPFVDNVIGFKSEVVNDLFFSGHVADLSFFAFCCKNRMIRNFLIISAVSVAVMVLFQKVHYTADVLAAPFFAYFCYRAMVKKHIHIEKYTIGTQVSE